MVRILTYIYVLLQVGILLQIHHLKLDHTEYSFIPSLDFLKVAEIIVFTPILLILAHRTRQMRAYYLRHIHEDEEADEAKARAEAAKNPKH